MSYAQEVDWNEIDTNSSRESDFLKIEEGENTVRVMSNPIPYSIHWLENNGKKKKFNSPADNPALVRRLEDAGFKKKQSYFLKVLDRKTEKYKILEIGPQIFNGIKTLYSNKKWGKLSGYDISINRAPKGTQPLYSVSPNPHEALSADIKAKFVEFNDRVDLNKFTGPGSSEQIMEFMGWTGATSSSKSSTKTSRPVHQFDDESDE